ncbi:BGTF surface domain-containing protein [Halorubrum vacuolatum]|uniref:PGF-CTERM protein n=1 Tax=Halorubrum vacuolatum TaxID=63740 RepID=A0A238W590_HALVU|nr:BGTF surface domain-containing protein [Halorubrum vacuolatum]SNR41571.1 PGF-CTERM protein [Halorubrum vacuolatum]
MTRTHNHTRTKAVSVFFSAIMVFSMVAVGVTVTPAAASPAIDSYDPENPWQGQAVTATVDGLDPGDEVDLRRVTDTSNGGSTVSSSTFIEELDVEADNGDRVVRIDTDDLDSGDYFLSGSGLSSTPSMDDTFEVRIQRLDAAFDDDVVTDFGADSETDLDISSNRGTYTLNVSADGDLDSEELFTIFVDADSENHPAGDNSIREDLIDPDNDIDDLGDLYEAIRAGTYDGEFDTADDVTSGDIWGEFNVFLYAEGKDDDLDHDEKIGLHRITDREEAVDFDGIDGGDYEFLFEVTDTAAEATASITVDDVDDAELSFVDSTVDVAQGGVASITVEANDAADSGLLVIGEIDDFGYQLNVTIESFNDDDRITLYFNTYTAGTSDDGDGTDLEDIIWVDEDDADEDAAIDYSETEEHEDSDTLEFILSEGDYDMSVIALGDFDDAVDDPDDVGSLLIDERETTGLNVWTAAADTVDDIDAVDDVLAGAEAGNVTQRDLVTQDDWAIFELDATGLDGMFQYATDNGGLSAITNTNNAADDTLLAQEESDRAARVRLRETRASAGPNADRRLVDWEQADYEIITTAGQSTVFIAVDTDSWNDDHDVFDPGAALDEEDDYEFIMNVRIEDEWLLEFDEEEDDDLDDLFQTIESSFDVEERTGQFRHDPYEVTATEDVEIVASTNVAPGTELTIRARSSGDTRPSFIMSDSDLVVTQNEDVTGTFDFSGKNVGDTFDLTLRPTGQFPDDVEAEGIVVDEIDATAVFEVSDLDPADADVELGDVIDASATITNTGTEDATKDVEVRVDGDTIATQEIELEAGEDVTAEFEIDTSDLDAGDYTHSVWTEDDEETGSLTIVDPDADDDDVDDADDADDADADDEPADVDDDTPGFGVLVALAALLAAALLAVRRRS